MMDDDLITIVAKVFSIPESEVNDNSSPENIESWDSFNGLILVDELENHFKIKFSIWTEADIMNTIVFCDTLHLAAIESEAVEMTLYR